MSFMRLILLTILHVTCTKEVTAFGHNLDELVSKANIYYQQMCVFFVFSVFKRILLLRIRKFWLFSAFAGGNGELLLNEVEELPSKTDIKLIIHGFTSSRFHFSITPLRNGKYTSTL